MRRSFQMRTTHPSAFRIRANSVRARSRSNQCAACAAVTKSTDPEGRVVSSAVPAIDVKRGLGQTGSKVISNEEELALTLGLQKVNEAVKAFHAQVKATSALDPAAKGKLLQLLGGVTTSLADLNQSGVLGIHNPDAKSKVAAVLAGITASIATIQAVLGGA